MTQIQITLSKLIFTMNMLIEGLLLNLATNKYVNDVKVLLSFHDEVKYVLN